MIIFLDKFDTNSFSTEERLSILENLACAHYENKHFVMGIRQILVKFSGMSGLSLRAQTTFSNLAKNAQVGSLLQQATVMVKLTTDVKTAINPKRANKIENIFPYDFFLDSPSTKTEIILPYAFFLDASPAQKTILLCENLDDCKFYEYIAINVPSKDKGIKCSFRHLSGGGNTTHSVYKNQINSKSDEKQFCFCIIDNDKKHPDAKIGDTASKFPNQPSKFQSYKISTSHAAYEILDCHEIELLIPFKLLINVLKITETDKIDCIDILCNLEKDAFDNIKYLDLKNGYTFKKLISYDNEQNSHYWRNIIKKFKPKSIKPDCLNKCECQFENACRCYFPIGLGSNILSRTLNHPISPQKFLEYLQNSPSKKEFVRELGEKIFWWGCAPSGAKKIT